MEEHSKNKGENFYFYTAIDHIINNVPPVSRYKEMVNSLKGSNELNNLFGTQRELQKLLNQNTSEDNKRAGYNPRKIIKELAKAAGIELELNENNAYGQDALVVDIKSQKFGSKTDVKTINDGLKIENNGTTTEITWNNDFTFYQLSYDNGETQIKCTYCPDNSKETISSNDKIEIIDHPLPEEISNVYGEKIRKIESSNYSPPLKPRN